MKKLNGTYIFSIENPLIKEVNPLNDLESEKPSKEILKRVKRLKNYEGYYNDVKENSKIIDYTKINYNEFIKLLKYYKQESFILYINNTALMFMWNTIEQDYTLYKSTRIYTIKVLPNELLQQTYKNGLVIEKNEKFTTLLTFEF